MPEQIGVKDLINQWEQLVTDLNETNNEQIAYSMVGLLATNDVLWAEWYESGKEPKINKVFDNVSDLELPDGVLVKDEEDRKARWEEIKTCILELKDKYS